MGRILIIADDPPGARGLSAILRSEGHLPELLGARADATRALARGPELLVLSVAEPAAVMDGLVCVAGGGLRRIPALAITTHAEQASEPGPEVTVDPEAATPGGADWLLDPLPMPFSDATLLGRVEGLLRVREILAHAPEAGGDPNAPASGAGPASGLMGRLLRGWRGGNPQLSGPKSAGAHGSPGARLQTAAAVVAAVEGRDAFDPGHGDRVAFHCASIATALGLPDEETAFLLHAAWAHDIGKIALPAELLGKGELTEADRALVKSHPRRGAQLLRALSPWADAAPIIACHHERPDGRGYYGVPPERVPRAAWILSVAEAYDAMTRARQRAALEPEEALEKLSTDRGSAWDAEALDALSSTIRPSARRQNRVPVSDVPDPFAALKR